MKRIVGDALLLYYVLFNANTKQVYYENELMQGLYHICEVTSSSCETTMLERNTSLYFILV